MLKKILFLLSNALLWKGAWQLDLLAAPAFWDWQNYSARYPNTVCMHACKMLRKIPSKRSLHAKMYEDLLMKLLYLIKN